MELPLPNRGSRLSVIGFVPANGQVGAVGVLCQSLTRQVHGNPFNFPGAFVLRTGILLRVTSSELPAAELSVALLLTRDPDRTAAFYRDVLGVALVAERHDGRQTHYAGRLGSLYFTIQSAADIGEVPERGHDSLQLCFTVPDLEAFLRHLGSLGLSPLHPPTPFERTTFVTLLDPDRRHLRVMTPWKRG